MTDAWPSKKEYEAALREIHKRLEALAAAGGGGGEMVYTNAATDTHSGNGSYRTVINVSGKGQAVIFTGGTPAQSTYQYLKITVDGVAVVTDMVTKKAGQGALCAEVYWGVWNFNVSLKIEHKSDSAAALCRVAYCCA